MTQRSGNGGEREMGRMVASQRERWGAVRVSGIGIELPDRVVSSSEVEEQAGLARFALEPGWVERVTGVRERRWAAPDVAPSALAAGAATRALADAGLDALEIDAVLYTGISRDCLDPATARVVADTIGARHTRAFDVINGANGVLDAIDLAELLIRSGRARRVLVTAAERGSLAINWDAQSIGAVLQSVTALAAGDAGGAIVLEASDQPGSGLLEREFHSDGLHWRHATGGSFRGPGTACESCGGPLDHTFICNSREFLAAVAPLLAKAIHRVLARTGWSHDEVDLVFCHQPTARLIEAAATLAGDLAQVLPRLWRTAERFGNTGTCSLPLAMAEARACGVLVPGAKVLLLAPSSGASAGAATVAW
jgi:3-oxoacyl-[acyl-carrier-protein] synthase-3